MTTFSQTLSHSVACERNQEPIKDVLKNEIIFGQNFLEIGFGTAQHAFFFSSCFPDISYYAADQEQAHLNYLQRKMVLGAPENLFGPFQFKASDKGVLHNLNDEKFSQIYSANTLHIMSWPECQSFLKFAANLLEDQGKLFLYGPFKFNGDFTSESNEAFDKSLRARDPKMGIRSFEDVEKLLLSENLHQSIVYDLPAHNNLLVFTKRSIE